MCGDMANGKDFASEPIGDGGNGGGGGRWPSNAGSVISGFRPEVDENCVLLGCYAANSDRISYRRFGTAYRSHLQGVKVGILTLEGGTNRMSQNVGKKFITTRCIITKWSAVLF